MNFLLDDPRPAGTDAGAAASGSGDKRGSLPERLPMTMCSQGDRTEQPSFRQLEQAFELASDAILLVDREWTITHANRRAASLFRLSGLLPGTPVSQAVRGDIPVAVEQALRQAMEQRTPLELEAFFPPPLNVWLWINVSPCDEGLMIFLRDVSARREREERMRRESELLAIIQQTALAATWEIELATGRICFGPGSFPLFGVPLEDLGTVHDFLPILYAPDREPVEVAYREALESNVPVVVDFRVVSPDGRRIAIESRATVVVEDGAAKLLRGISIDVTQRKASEEALVTSEMRYRVLADLNPQAIWMGAPDGTILYANHRLLDYTGQTLDAFVGSGWLQAFHPEDRDRVLNQWAHSVLTGADFDTEARLVRALDGAARWWCIRARAVRDDTGAILHWLGVSNDIHDTRMAADILRQKHLESERQRAELETIYQTAPVGLALFDPVELRCLRLNEREAEILGLPIDRVVGHTLSEIAPMPGLEKMFRDAAAGVPARNQVIEGELPTRPSERRVWNVSVMPVHDEEGAVQAITAAWLEITHLKRAESALVQSEKLAAVGRLASSISHEINNPLEAITNLLYLIAHHTGLPGELKSFVHMAQSELARVSQIATQTLRFHRQAVRPTWVTGAELIDAVINLYQGRLANSGIRVRTDYATETRVLCFENDIRQVLNNLIANAIDAMRGGGELLARAHNAVDFRTGRRGVRLTIADNGHGMPRTVQERIFEPFFTTKDLNGTGLGLWISEGIVQRHQGRLTLRSSQGTRHGTVFNLFLPCAESSHLKEMAA